MKRFIKYILGVLLAVLLVCTLVTLTFGWVAGLTLFSLFMAVVAVRDAWQLQSLSEWLQDQKIEGGPVAGGTWQQVFGGLHRLERHADLTEQKFRDALDRFERAMNRLPMGIVIVDPLQRIQWCNPSAEQHLGIQLEQDRGQSLTYLVRNSEFNDFLTAPTSTKGLVLRRMRGTDLVLFLQRLVYSDSEEMIVTRDITQSERDERIRQDFVANVSHELRTPLTVIGGFVETLQESPSIEPALLRKVLTTLEGQTRRMQRLVEELLSLSRLEQSVTAPLTQVSVEFLMVQMAQMARHLSEGQHTIEVQFEPGDLILGSESELLSAFGNLVTNAVRYTPAGGVIRLNWERSRAGGCFSVMDSGVGIAAEHIPRLTERFYRVDRGRSRETGGTGLGLAIVKQIALHHDAKLKIDSTPNQGSLFSFTIPDSRLSREPVRNQPVTP